MMYILNLYVKTVQDKDTMHTFILTYMLKHIRQYRLKQRYHVLHGRRLNADFQKHCKREKYAINDFAKNFLIS